MSVERARLGFDPAVEVRPSNHAVPHELHDGDTVIAGDRIRVSVVTSEDAYLYLAFCAHHELAIYPSQLGVRTQAGMPTYAPEGAELVVDRQPGTEVLYLILSRSPLSLADPRLTDQLAASAHRGGVVDCGDGLDADLAKPAHPARPAGSVKPSPSSKTRVLRGQVVAKQPRPPAVPPQGPPPSRPGFQPRPVDDDYVRRGGPGSVVWYAGEGAGRPVDMVAADQDGIAVLRYRFIHIAATAAP